MLVYCPSPTAVVQCVEICQSIVCLLQLLFSLWRSLHSIVQLPPKTVDSAWRSVSPSFTAVVGVWRSFSILSVSYCCCLVCGDLLVNCLSPAAVAVCGDLSVRLLQLLLVCGDLLVYCRSPTAVVQCVEICQSIACLLQLLFSLWRSVSSSSKAVVESCCCV